MTRKQVRFILGIAFFALLLVFSAGSFYVWLYPHGSDAGWYMSDYVSNRYGEFRVKQIDPQGPAQELRRGDKIIAVNGVKVAEHPSAVFAENFLPPQSRYAMTIERNGQEMTFAWQTIPRPRGAFPWDKLIPLLFWLIGLIVLLLKAEDQQAWLLALMLGSFSAGLDTRWQHEIATVWLALPVALAHIGGLFAAPLLFHLFLYFPQPSPWLRRWPQLTRWLYVPLCLFVLPTGGVMRLPFEWAASIVNWPPLRWLWDHGLLLASNLTLFGYLLAALVCLWLSYRTADVAGRRRLRVVMWGSLIGFSSLSLVLAIDATNTQDQWRSSRNWLWFSMRFTLPLVPLSFAYAIVRHRVIPISLMLRRGVRYLLVSRGSMLLVMIGVGAAGWFLLDALFRNLHINNGRIVGTLSAITAILGWHYTWALHQRLIAPAIDRRFFRQAYDAQQIMAELADSMRATTNRAELLELGATKIQAALQTEHVTILLPDEASKEYTSAYSHSYNGTPDIHLAQNDAIVQWLQQSNQPLELDEETNTLPASLLLPLKGKDNLSGIVALGARRGDLPFSNEDKQLLLSVGAPMSFALENTRLIEQMIEDARRREELEAENEQRAKELEEARQLQLSMLPKKLPELPNVEVAAYMKTATEVGGDYYDFHVADDGTLTIAIGDATGHGLKAGTVVTATKSLFNELANEADLPLMLKRFSHSLKKMNLRSLFMAMTVARLKNNSLTITAAGMPPILIYRASQQRIEEVFIKAMPLGCISNYSYKQEEVALASSDIVVLMSDGFPERFNPANEMLGYDQAKQTLASNAHLSSQEILARLVQIGDEWGQSRLADDDVTFVVLKIR